MNPTAPSPIDAILSNPTGTLVVGPKPIATRRLVTLGSLGQAALNVLKKAPVLLALGMAANLAYNHTGLSEELAAQRSPALGITAPAENVHWVSLPTSPFLEVGRNDEGGLSVPGIINGWKNAGLPNAAFDDVRALTTALMPTLLGRDDPFLEAQLASEAQAANDLLKERYPDVWQRLEQGQTVAVSPAEEEAWHALFLEREARFHADTTMTASHYALQARAVAMASVAEGTLQTVLAPGLDAQGRFDADRLLHAWEQAGLDTGSAVRVMDLLDEAMPVMAAGTMASKMEQAGRADEALTALEKDFPEFLDRLQNGASPQVSQEQRQAWENEREFLLEDFRDGRGFATEEVSWEQATAALAASVKESGLRSLTVAWADWASPQALKDRADFITAANQELEEVTGWKGHALGLSGRVELTLSEPLPQWGAGGITSRNEAGRLQVVTRQGALAHEWFHAVDFSLASQVMTHPNQAPLSDNLQWLRQARDTGSKQAWHTQSDALFEAAPQWQAHRQKAGEKNSYWVDRSEGMAFAFAAQFQDRPGSVLRDPALEVEAAMSPERAPGLREREKQTPIFQALFKGMHQHGLTTDTPTVAEWRAQRQKLMEEQPRMTMRGNTYR